MESAQGPMTLDEFYERIVEPRAKRGHIPSVIMWAAWQATKEGKMTPELASELAKRMILS